MIGKKIIATAVSVAMMSAVCSSYAMAADTEKHTVTFLDFDGNVMNTISVMPDEKINYSAVDTSSLSTHIDTYTERIFSSWDITPETTEEDITIRALYKSARISLDSYPQKKVYFNRNGRVNTKGLKVSVTIDTQTNEKDKDGKYIITTRIVDISASCQAEPSAISDILGDSSTGTVNIKPAGQDKVICSYQISCCDYFGDVNGNGSVDSVDASAVLSAYATTSVTKNYVLTDEFKERADVNTDNIVDAKDASRILQYYAMTSVKNTFDWDDIDAFFA